nr:rep protein [Cressdnaviricota sp.]
MSAPASDIKEVGLLLPPLRSHSAKMSQSLYFCFTRFEQHGSLEIETIKEALIPLCTYFTFQLELAPGTGQLHVQGYVILKKRVRARTFAQSFPCHAEPRRGNHSQAKAYCQKETSRVPGTGFVEHGVEPVARQGARSDIVGFKNAILDGADDLLLADEFPAEFAKFPRFVSMVRHAKLSADVLRNLPVFQPRLGWQWALAQRLGGAPSAREVHWRWEPVGNVGKSFFALNFKPVESFIITGGRHADIHYAYAHQPYVFFDWARCSQDTFPYGLVEQFKNGYFLSTKYESTPKRFVVPHVVVFANFAPDLSQMSADRWQIEQIN